MSLLGALAKLLWLLIIVTVLLEILFTRILKCELKMISILYVSFYIHDMWNTLKKYKKKNRH